MSHSAYLHRQKDHDGDQTHAEPVEQDHAVANPRGLIAVETCDLLRGHGWRHRMDEAGKQEERGHPNDRQYRQCPEKDQLTISASHSRTLFMHSVGCRSATWTVADRQPDGQWSEAGSAESLELISRPAPTSCCRPPIGWGRRQADRRCRPSRRSRGRQPCRPQHDERLADSVADSALPECRGAGRAALVVRF